MSKRIVDSQKEVYGSSFREFGDSPQGTMQNNLLTQHIRYSRLMKELLRYKANDFSIHDVGSGLCDMHAYLASQNLRHEYSGTELVDEMIVTSKKKYPGLKLVNRNLVEASDTSERYDFTVLSGTFNVPGTIPLNEWKEYANRLLLKMYAMSNVGISFNFLTEYRTRTDAALAYFQPEELFSFCMKNMSRFVTLDHSYPLFEGTITVVKPEAVKALHAQPELAKYFGAVKRN